MRNSKLKDSVKLRALLLKVLITDEGSNASRLTCLWGRQTFAGMECLSILSDEVSGGGLEMTGDSCGPLRRDPTTTVVSPGKCIAWVEGAQRSA